jgi:hypothetical protein
MQHGADCSFDCGHQEAEGSLEENRPGLHPVRGGSHGNPSFPKGPHILTPHPLSDSQPPATSPAAPYSPGSLNTPMLKDETPLPQAVFNTHGYLSHLPSAHLRLECCQSCLCFCLAVHSHGDTGGLQANRHTSTGGRGSMLRTWVDAFSQDWSDKLLLHQPKAQTPYGVCTFMCTTAYNSLCRTNQTSRGG